MTAWLDAVGSVRALVPLRIAAGPLVIAHLQPFLAASLDGITPGDTFVTPFASWYPVLPSGLYVTLLWGAAGAAVLVSLGWFTRVATGYVAGFVAHNLFLSQTHFHHNRAFLLILLVGLALLPVGRHVSIDALRHPGVAAATPLWPLWLMRFEVAAVYSASGFSKLIDGDWWGGTVLRLRIEQWRDVAADRGIPEGVLDLLADAGFMAGFSKIVVLTELFIGLGLLWPRTRRAAIWVAIPFHLAIELTAEVQVFSWAALAALVIWVAPTERPWTLSAPPDHWLARTAAWFDWTGRLRIQAGPLTLQGPSGTVHDRRIVATTLSLLPVTFWFAAPFAAARRARTPEAARP